MPGSAKVTNPKRFACPLCPKKFTSNSYKNAHVLVIHQNAGRFKCTQCSRSFENRASFEIHSRIHTEKRFKCLTCDRQFGRECDLKLHLDMHSTERPFQCELCSKVFRSKKKLREHDDHCHAEKKFNCENCGRGFAKKYILNRHLRLYSNKLSECTPRGTSFRRQEQPSGSNSPSSVTSGVEHSLRGKPENHGEDDFENDDDESNESSSAGSSKGDHQDDEPSEPEEAARGDDVLDEEQNRTSRNEWPAKRANAKKWTSDGVRGFDDPIKQRKTERDSDGQTSSDAAVSAASYRPSDASPTIFFSPDMPSSVCGANLKVVFGVEYRAPD